MLETGKAYAMELSLPLPYDAAIERVTQALAEQGFGVLTTIDVAATLRVKLDLAFRRYAILGACNPHLAHRALTGTLDAGLMLPCNVVVYEEGPASSRVAILDPTAQMRVADHPSLTAVAIEARERLHRAAEALAAQE